MPIVFDNLKPYKSYVLSEFREDDPDFDSFDTGIIEEVKHVINSAQPRHGEISIQQSEPLTSFGDLRIGFVHYLETRMANWADGVDVKDMIQQIVVVARRGNIVVFCASDNAMAGRLLRSPSNQYPILSLLRGISSGRLNLAFATGQARTLWLSGTHRRIPVKADNKVLSGMDLRFALDPLDDQTFIFTSARCVPETELQGIHQVGITPRKSRAWIGPTYEWDEFVQVTDTFLAHLNAATGSTDDPFPVLSAPLNDASPLDTAYDVALIPLELIADITQLSDEERQEIERWTVQACYEVGDVSGPDFNLDVNLGSQQIGTLTFKLDQTVLPFARYEITTKSVGSGDEAEELLDEATKYLSRRGLLGVWYESGHTVKDGQVYTIRHREFPFTQISWKEFTGFDVSKEKPGQLDSIGDEDSLFCWMKQNSWVSGHDFWLACDDGSMEIADFITFDADVPELSLVHVKGAKSDKQTRGISVAAYEIVVGQAVKNMRFLDQMILRTGLQAGLNREVSDLVWHNNQDGNRTDLINAIIGAGADIGKKVCVLQPHVTSTRHSAARANMDNSDGKRLRQLDTLLLSAQANVQSLGAKFEVIMEQIPSQ